MIAECWCLSVPLWNFHMPHSSPRIIVGTLNTSLPPSLPLSDCSSLSPSLRPSFPLSLLLSVPPSVCSSLPLLLSGAFKAGLLPGNPSGQYFNKYFRYASIGINISSGSPRWNVGSAIDWRSYGGRSFLGPVRDQGLCGKGDSHLPSHILDAPQRLSAPNA